MAVMSEEIADENTFVRIRIEDGCVIKEQLGYKVKDMMDALELLGVTE